MITSIFLIIFIQILLFQSCKYANGYELSCSTSKLGCLCQDIEKITAETVSKCCKENIRTLIINGTNVKTLFIDISGSKCTEKFTVLWIQHTKITNFSSSFVGLENLDSIFIEKNENLSDLDQLVFAKVSKKIESISVESNDIRNIWARTWANLSNLQILHLSNNKIGFIESDSFKDSGNLTGLYLNSNLFTVIRSEMLSGLKNLKVLSLFKNPHQQPQDNIFKSLINLQFLQMSLEPNSMSNFGFQILSDKFFFPSSGLKSINMTSMRIEKVTSLSFFGLKALERLELPNNLLTHIPSETFEQIPKVSWINLSKNRIQCLLPGTFKNLPHLKTLDLSNNDITYISDEVFSDLSKLQTLDISDNNLYIIESNAFVNLDSLIVMKINVVLGRARNDIVNNFALSSLAKLSKLTTINGLFEYFGISRGLGEQRDLTVKSKNNSKSQADICPIAKESDRDFTDLNNMGNRKYLLIIVGICVLFLLIALAIIMTYRAWSKRKMGNLSLDIEAEKQEMLANGNVEKDSNPRPNHNARKSMNGTSEKRTENVTGSGNVAVQNQQITISGSSADRPGSNCHSDDESALTPLGVL